MPDPAAGGTHTEHVEAGEASAGEGPAAGDSAVAEDGAATSFRSGFSSASARVGGGDGDGDGEMEMSFRTGFSGTFDGVFGEEGARP